MRKPLKTFRREQIITILKSPTAKWCGVLFVLALLPRLVWALAGHPQPFSDMEDYYLCAVNFLKGGYLAQSPDRLAYRAPMYPLFLAACLRILPGDPLLMIRLVQSVLGSVSAVLVFAITRRLLHPLRERENISWLTRYMNGFAFALGLLYAWMAYPIFFCSVFMTETFFIVMFLTWILWSLYLDKHSSIWTLAGFSFMLGVLALIRPIALFFIPVLIGKILTCRSLKEKVGTNCIPLVVWALPILPWTIRNLLVFHAFVLISTNSGVNMFIGNNPTFGYYESGYKEAVRREYRRQYGPDEAGEDRLFMRKGLEQIVHDPRAALVRGGWKFYFLYLLDKEPWPWEEYNQGRGLYSMSGLGLPVVRWKPWFLWPALLGIIYAFVRRLRHGALLGVIGAYTLACMIFFARTRFRMPLEPLLVIYMGLGILSLVELAVWGYRKLVHTKSE